MLTKGHDRTLGVQRKPREQHVPRRIKEVVRKYRPQNDHLERIDLAKRFFIAAWERERAERAKRERERGAGA
jgi:hypothetical protein